MNTISRTTIRKASELLAILILLICTAASCGPQPAAPGPHCAFADAELMTSLGICNIAAEYYVAHREWPVSKAQLEEQWGKMLRQAKEEMPPEEAKQGAEFLNRFTLMEFRKKGDDLMLYYRFNIDTKAVNQRVTLQPGSTADEILQTATDGNK